MATQDNRGQDPSLRKAELAVEITEMVHETMMQGDGEWMRRGLVWALAAQACHYMSTPDTPVPDDEGLPMSLAVNYQFIEDLEKKAMEYDSLIEKGGKHGSK